MEHSRYEVVRTLEQVLYVGSGALQALADGLSDAGLVKIVVLASSSADRAGVVALVEHSLPAAVRVVRKRVGVREFSPAADSEALARELAGCEVDAIVAIGGGSVSDMAKAVSILLSCGGRLEDHCTSFTPPDQVTVPTGLRALTPVIAVPTTLSGAELTSAGGMRSTAGRKRTFWVREAAARMAAFDIDVLRRTPIRLHGTTGMNAIAHCVEGVYTPSSSVYSDALAVAGARHLITGLSDLASGDASDTTYEHLAAGAMFGGLVLAAAGTALHHSMCHVLGADLGVPHGASNAVILPSVVRYNSTRASRQLNGLCLAVDPAIGHPEALADALTHLAGSLGLATSLAELGVREEHLAGLVAGVLTQRGTYLNPGPVPDADDVATLLRAAL